MMQRVIGTASVVAILTLAAVGGAVAEQSQSRGPDADPRPGATSATAANPCAAKNPTSAKDRALRAPAWAGSVAAEQRVDRFSGGPLSDR